MTGALYTYPRGRSYSFGHIEFLSAARENLLHATAQAVSETEAVSDQWAEKFTRLQDTCKAEIAKKDAEAAQLRRQVDRLKLYQAQLEKEKSSWPSSCIRNRKIASCSCRPGTAKLPTWNGS